MGKSKILFTRIYYLPIHSLKSTIQAVNFKEERKTGSATHLFIVTLLVPRFMFSTK